jgi:hypothetical protein
VTAVSRRRITVLAPILPKLRLPARALLLPSPKLPLPLGLRPWFARPSRPRPALRPLSSVPVSVPAGRVLVPAPVSPLSVAAAAPRQSSF